MPSEDDETIIVRAILRDELSDSANDINRNLDDLRGSLDETADSTDRLTGAERRNQEQSERTARQIQAEGQQRAANGRFIREEARATDENTTSQRRNARTRSQSSKVVGKQDKIFSKLTGTLMQFVKVGAMLDGVSMAAQGIGALGTAAIAAGNGLAMMSGAALPLPALFAGVAQGAIVGKMAFSGMGDAVSALASGDYKKFGEATKDMAPAMVASAKAMGEFGQKMKPVTKEIQGIVWEGFAAQITKLGNNIFPALRKSLLGTAKGIHLAGEELLGFMNSAEGLRMMNNVLDGTSQISFELTSVMGAAGKATIAMANAVMPIARSMASDIADGIYGLSEAIMNNQAKITAFAERGYAIFKRFIGVIVDLAEGIYNIGKAATRMTGFIGTGLEDAARKFNLWTSSAEGQKKIAGYFEGMKPTLAALGNLAKALGEAFFSLSENTNLADLINKLAEAIPTFQTLIEQASGKFLPALLDAAKALADVVVDMNTLGATATLLHLVVIPLEMIAKAFDALPEPIQNVIGLIIAYTLVVRAAAATTVGTWVISMLMKTKIMQSVVFTYRLLIWIMKQYIIQLAKATAAQFVKGLGVLKVAIMAVGRGFMIAAGAVRAFAMSLLTFLFTNPIGWIILAVIVLIGVFVLLWKKCEGFRNLVKSIGQWFVDAWNNTLYPAIMKLWDWMSDVWNRVYGIVKTVVSLIVMYFRAQWTILKTVAIAVWNVISSVFMVAWNIISTLVRLWVAIFMGVFNIVKAIVMGAISFMISVFRLLAPVVGAVFNLIWQIVKIVFYSIRLFIFVAINIIIGVFKVMLVVWGAVWNVAKAVVLTIWNMLLAYWSFMWNIIKSVFMVIWNGILATIRFLMPIVQMVINFIVSWFQMGWNLVKTIISIAIAIITPIIRTMISIVTTVIGIVVSAFQTGWNFVAGIVNSVIGVISRVIESITSVVSNVVGKIRSGFESAFNAVRNFVMPIINTIKSAIDGIANAAANIGNKIKSLGDAVNPFNFAGGPVQAGLTSYVGELGPEAFVTHTGKVEMIGTKGMELRQFNQPGYIVPNHVLRGYSDSSVPTGVMNKLGKAMTPAEPTHGTYETRSARENLSHNTYMQDSKGGGDHYDFRNAVFGGNPAETKKAVIDALHEIERSKKERG